jgi:hypothetical protein
VDGCDRGNGRGGGIAGLEPLERELRVLDVLDHDGPRADLPPRPPVHNGRPRPAHPSSIARLLLRCVRPRDSLVRRPFDLGREEAGRGAHAVPEYSPWPSRRWTSRRVRRDPNSCGPGRYYNGLRVLLVVLGCWEAQGQQNVYHAAGFSCLLYLSPLRRRCASALGNWEQHTVTLYGGRAVNG